MGPEGIFMQGPRTNLFILSIFLLAVAGCIFDSDEDTYGADGYVRNTAGKPVSEVLIRKTGGESGSTYTRTDGYYYMPLNRQSDEIALIALKTGWVFCPGRIELTDFSVRHHDQDFTGFSGGEIVIDGYVKDSAGNPVSGVKIVNHESGVLYGLASVTDYLGYYRFNNIISSQRYLLVPQKAGCNFVPKEREYLLPEGDRLQQNYVVSCIESFGIEGHVKDFLGNPVEGVTLGMMPDDVTAVTDENGFYSKECLSPESAVDVTPAKTGCVFSPASKRIYAAVGGLSGVDFVVHCGSSYSVSGRVLIDGDTPVPGFKIVADGGCCPASSVRYTDDEGRYEFAGLRDGFDYVIRPELIEFAAEPESIVIEQLDRDYVEQDFALITSEMVTFRVTGTVRDNQGNPLEGMEIGASFIFPRSGDADGMEGDMPDTHLLPSNTDEEGHFSISLPRSYTVTFYVEKAGCYFIPYARWCSGDRDHENQDFVAHCGGGAAISGYVHDIFGRPAPEVRVEVKGEGYYPPPFDRTDSTGYYEFTDLPNGLELTVRPMVDYSVPYEGCIFCPAERVYFDVKEDLSNQNFTISCPSNLGAGPAPMCISRPDP
jgi:hypothetical protein